MFSKLDRCWLEAISRETPFEASLSVYHYRCELCWNFYLWFFVWNVAYPCIALLVVTRKNKLGWWTKKIVHCDQQWERSVTEIGNSEVQFRHILHIHILRAVLSNPINCNDKISVDNRIEPFEYAHETGKILVLGISRLTTVYVLKRSMVQVNHSIHQPSKRKGSRYGSNHEEEG